MSCRTANKWPSDENAMLFTTPLAAKIHRKHLSATCHNRTVSSTDPEAKTLPSEEKARLFTQEVCPSRVLKEVLSANRHTLHFSDTEARNRSSVEHTFPCLSPAKVATPRLDKVAVISLWGNVYLSSLTSLSILWQTVIRIALSIFSGVPLYPHTHRIGSGISCTVFAC